MREQCAMGGNTYSVLAERVALSETLIDLHIDDRCMMTLENSDVLLSDVWIPNACQIVSTARDQDIQ